MAKVFLSLAFASLLLTSCVTTKQFEKPFNAEKAQGSTSQNETFIITKNGEKITGEKLTFKKGYTVYTANKNWIAIDGKKFSEKDFYAYQDKEAYYVYHKDALGLPMFIPRIRRGKINLYFYERLAMGVRADDVRGASHAFVIEKEKGNLYEVTFDNLKAAISDNADAISLLQKAYPNGKIPRFDDNINLKRLTGIVEFYNK